MKTSGRVRSLVQAVILPVVLTGIWQWAVSSNWVPRTIVASPAATFKDFWQLLVNGVFLENFAISFGRLFGGFFLGSFLGVTLGITIAYYKTIARFAEPLLLAVIPVPPLAWIALMVVVFGTGDLVKIALIACGCFATMFLSTSTGTRGIDKKYLELAQIYRKSNWQILTKIVLPAVSPVIFSSLRVAMALSWTLLMAGEMIKSSGGLGWFLTDARNFSRADDLMAGILIVGLLGKLTDYTVVWFGWRLTKWQNKIDV